MYGMQSQQQSESIALVHRRLLRVAFFAKEIFPSMHKTSLPVHDHAQACQGFYTFDRRLHDAIQGMFYCALILARMAHT